MTEPINIIFLDFDGVLNSTRSVVAFHNRSGNGWRDDSLDDVAVNLVRRLCEEGPASIVISSTWRRGRQIDFFTKLFKEHHKWDPTPIVGMTPRSMRGHRGNEVAEWLEEYEQNGGIINNYVCLDDSSDFYLLPWDYTPITVPGMKPIPREGPDSRFRYSQPLVKVNPDVGLSLDDYRDALRILNPTNSELKLLKGNDV